MCASISVDFSFGRSQSMLIFNFCLPSVSVMFVHICVESSSKCSSVGKPLRPIYYVIFTYKIAISISSLFAFFLCLLCTLIFVYFKMCLLQFVQCSPI